MAVIGNPAFSFSQGDIGVASLISNSNGVFVITSDNVGADADRNFHLAVFC